MWKVLVYSLVAFPTLTSTLYTELEGTGDLTRKKRATNDDQHRLRLQCSGRCNSKCRPVWRNTENDNNRCQCDIFCEIIGDCCFGYEKCKSSALSANQTHRITAWLKYLLPYMSCYNMFEWMGGQNNYFLVTRCPDGYQYKKIAELCHAPSDYMRRDEYVSSTVTDGVVSFRNSYCALCHGLRENGQVEMWTRSTRCKEEFIDCYADNYIPNSMDHVKSLTPSLYGRACSKKSQTTIDYCPRPESILPAVVSDEIRHNCGKHEAPVVGEDGRVYKDISCSLCNGWTNLENQTCLQQNISVYPHLITFMDDLSELLLLEDLMASNCLEWELYDKVLKVCKEVICSEGYAFIKGVCRRLAYLSLHLVPTQKMNTQSVRSLLESFDIGEGTKTFGLRELILGDKWHNVSKVEAMIYSRSSLSLAQSEMDYFILRVQSYFHCKTGNLTIMLFGLTSGNSSTLTEQCSLKNSIEINARDRSLHRLIGDLSKEEFWEITGNDVTMTLKSYLCANWTMLACPKVLYRKEDYAWEDGVPVIGRHKLAQDQFETVGEYVYICRDALIAKWFLFSGLSIHDQIQNIIIYVGISFSLVGLAYTLFTYTLLSQLRTLPGKMLMHLCVALFFSQIIFVSLLYYTTNELICTVVAITEHYFWLVSFFWMNSLAFNAMKTFSTKGLQDRTKATKALLSYSLYSWGVPALIVGACAFIEFCDCTKFRIGYGNERVCWISELYPLVFSFITPLGLIVVSNMCLFSYTIFSIFRVTQVTKTVDRKDRQQLWLYVKLSAIMGLTWVFGLMASVTNFELLWYVFIIFNTTQGALIAIGFATSKRIFRMYFNESRKTTSDENQ